MFKLNTMQNNERMSTQDLLQAINAAIAEGETEFSIEASGQHDIGGPLWHPEGKTLKFFVTNPGQRVGCMCLENTEIYVEGTASADVGWLNAGGKIVVKGDGGDTSAHCAASGKVFVGGRVGTRSGSLMKHDPLYSAPEFWVLKNCGSFSFEFMSGGIAVVCGYDSEQFADLLLNEVLISELTHYSWAGNIRELDHCIERSVILSGKKNLKLLMPQDEESMLREPQHDNVKSLNIEEMEEILIKKALKKHRGNISLAAEDLGLSRAALYRRMEKFEL